MKLIKLAGVAVLALSIAGCDNFRKDGAEDDLARSGAGTSGASANAASDSITSGQLDPNSVAFFKQSIGDTVLFLVDQSTLTPAASGILDSQAAWLLERPAMQILIEGHADEQGTREYNLALGARRASSVRNYLVSKGIPDSRLKTITYGKERPLELCSDEACWSKNRRSVTVVAGGLNS